MKKFTMFMAFLVGCTGGTGASGADAGDAGGGDVSLDGATQDTAAPQGTVWACQRRLCGAKTVTCGCEAAGTVQPADTACTSTTVAACDDGDPATVDSCGFGGCAHQP